MLDKQRELQERLGYDIDNMSTEERTAFIKEFSIHLNNEMNELLYELPYFKPWKDYDKETFEQIVERFNKGRKEYIDMIHFMLNIALALGLDEDDLYTMYMDKNKENHDRQDRGY